MALKVLAGLVSTAVRTTTLLSSTGDAVEVLKLPKSPVINTRNWRSLTEVGAAREMRKTSWSGPACWAPRPGAIRVKRITAGIKERRKIISATSAPLSRKIGDFQHFHTFDPAKRSKQLQDKAKRQFYI